MGVTSQRVSRSDFPSLSINYPTNYRMLRHDRVDEIFHAEAFFLQRKKRHHLEETPDVKSLSQTKVFLFVVPMKSKGLLPQEMKKFSK